MQHVGRPKLDNQTASELIMVGKVIPATPEERRVQDVIKTCCGCLPCLLENRIDIHATIQHVTECRKRVGQWAVYGSCQWHHLGIEWPDRDFGWMLFRHGPSLAHNKKLFEATYGRERLLVELQAYMVGLYDLEPWQPFHVPVHVVRKVKSFWVKLIADQPN